MATNYRYKRVAIGRDPKTGKTWYRRVPVEQERIKEVRSISGLISQVQQLDYNVRQAFIEAVYEHADEIVSIVGDVQLYEMGAAPDANGTLKPITPPYSWVTINQKIIKGQPFDRVTLRDTGNLRSGMYLEFDEDDEDPSFSVAPDIYDAPYAIDLVEKYGANIFKPSEQLIRERIFDRLKPAIIRAVRRNLGLSDY